MQRKLSYKFQKEDKRDHTYKVENNNVIFKKILLQQHLFLQLCQFFLCNLLWLQY